MNTYPFTDQFVNRHCGSKGKEIDLMLEAVGADSLATLASETVPADILLSAPLEIPEAITEHEFLQYITSLAAKNTIAKSYIGLGYYPTITPAVIRRNILENPGWYTQYTPYQAEISQGRLEALMNYQTLIADLTALPVANASLLDEATAAAEAMLMLFSHAKTTSKNGSKFFVSSSVFPQTLEVLKTRALPFNIELVTGDEAFFVPSKEFFGCLLQYPGVTGKVVNLEAVISECKAYNIFVTVASDLLALTLLKAPGEFGADVCVGSSQRFGVPMGFGGPHAAFFACKEDFKRLVPGRIIGASVDANGKLAFRMALQTREQHIKREKATSNICTAQVLLAIMAGMYAVYHGPEGIKNIARRIHSLTAVLNAALKELGFNQVNDRFFDTLAIETTASEFLAIKAVAESADLNFYYPTPNQIQIALGETVTIDDVKQIVDIFATAKLKKGLAESLVENVVASNPQIGLNELARTSGYLTHANFNSFHTETELMRYIKGLENKDLSLTTSMIALGSCTMKLNAAAEMLGITLPGFSEIHPFAPHSQLPGYLELVNKLGSYLKAITGFAAVSFQPNSGAQGEYAGLMVIRQYLRATNQENRTIALIPASAHGTNPASAVMAGMKVVVVACDDHGNIDLADLRAKAEQYKETLAALMVTYPSTHGVFELQIREICAIIHAAGGLVYMDGANMNAQVGLTSPGTIGADVCHLNLHKTFAIPHGGGGPGMGPICVSEKLVPYLPEHVFNEQRNAQGMTAVSAAHFGSASILPISLGYIMMLGAEGLKQATQIAILNANYLKAQLEAHFKVLYTGETGRVGHELIFDFREFKKTAGVEVEDVAKRLMDYGYHAPTVSFPVPGTLMVEPTESESKAELDRFIEALISIKLEIAEIERGEADKTDNVLKNAPHTADSVTADEWNHSYSRQKAAYPVAYLRKNKFWPSVGRINNAYGDRNLVCTCNDIAEYASAN